MADNSDINPIKTASGKDLEIDLYEDIVIIRHKGISNRSEVMFEWLHSQIKSFIISKSEDLLSGTATIATENDSISIDFKSYQVKSFEEIKSALKL